MSYASMTDVSSVTVAEHTAWLPTMPTVVKCLWQAFNLISDISTPSLVSVFRVVMQTYELEVKSKSMTSLCNIEYALKSSFYRLAHVQYTRFVSDR